MPVEFIDTIEGPTLKEGSSKERTVVHLARGSTSQQEVYAALLNYMATSFDGYPLKTISVEPFVGADYWKCELGYGLFDPQENQDEDSPPEESFEMSFATTGGTANRKFSRRTTKYDGTDTGLLAPDFKGLINVTKDGVEGVDIVVPNWEHEVTVVKPNAAVNKAYIKSLFRKTGTVNNAEFLELFDEAECLFVGASGKRKDAQRWSITGRFQGSPTTTFEFDLFGGEATVEKKGHDYLWVYYRDEIDGDANALAPRPLAVYVEEIYERTDFSELGF